MSLPLQSPPAQAAQAARTSCARPQLGRPMLSSGRSALIFALQTPWIAKARLVLLPFVTFLLLSLPALAATPCACCEPIPSLRGSSHSCCANPHTAANCCATDLFPHAAPPSAPLAGNNSTSTSAQVCTLASVGRCRCKLQLPNTTPHLAPTGVLPTPRFSFLAAHPIARLEHPGACLRTRSLCRVLTTTIAPQSPQFAPSSPRICRWLI